MAARARLISLGIIAAWLGVAYPANAQTVPDFSDLSIEELSSIKITSFTNKQQALSQVAGAIYVITQEQIARSGLTSVPELLRLAPGIDVARVNGSQWSISARGATGIYANKLLVLIDGRSISTRRYFGGLLGSGDAVARRHRTDRSDSRPGSYRLGGQRGPGCDQYHHQKRTGHERDERRHRAWERRSERWGARAWEAASVPPPTAGHSAGPTTPGRVSRTGAPANDGWSSVQGGFRLDGADKQGGWMLKGDLFRGTESETEVSISPATFSQSLVPFSFDTAAGNLTGEWRRRLGKAAAGGELRIESYYDYANRPGPLALKLETRTWNTEVRYDFKAGRIHNLSVGAGERMISGSLSPQAGAVFEKDAVMYNNLDAFAQDEMHFLHDALLFTVGAKLDAAISPGGPPSRAPICCGCPARIIRWISAARALRTPTLWETGVSTIYSVAPPSAETKGLPVVTYIDGSAGFLNESVNDYEIGYRAQLTKSFSADITGFYDQYSDLRSLVGSTPTLALSPLPHLDLVGTVGNGAAAVGKGTEASFAWQAMAAWKLEGSYTYNFVDSWLTASASAGSVDGAGNPPSRNKWRLQSYVNLSKSWQLDTFLYWSSAGSPVNDFGPNVPVPAYTRLDVRVGYKASAHWQLSLAGQNVLQARHLEGLPELLTTYSYVDRGVYLKSSWQF